VVSFTPLPLHPRHPLDRRLGGPRTSLGAVEMRKISCPCREYDLDSSAIQIEPVALPTWGTGYSDILHGIPQYIQADSRIVP
jgi:hypothetical protein